MRISLKINPSLGFSRNIATRQGTLAGGLLGGSVGGSLAVGKYTEDTPKNRKVNPSSKEKLLTYLKYVGIGGVVGSVGGRIGSTQLHKILEKKNPVMQAAQRAWDKDVSEFKRKATQATTQHSSVVGDTISNWVKKGPVKGRKLLTETTSTKTSSFSFKFNRSKGPVSNDRIRQLLRQMAPLLSKKEADKIIAGKNTELTKRTSLFSTLVGASVGGGISNMMADTTGKTRRTREKKESSALLIGASIGGLAGAGLGLLAAKRGLPHLLRGLVRQTADGRRSYAEGKDALSAYYERKGAGPSHNWFNLNNKMSKQDVKSKVRYYKQLHHPDRGGDTSMFQKIMRQEKDLMDGNWFKGLKK